MLKRLRKSSSKVTLVLIGVAALPGCGDDERRDLYASREDCLADWGRKPEDCTPATDPEHARRGYFHGPVYVAPSPFTGWARSSGTASSTRSGGSSRSFSSSGTTSRGGFGSSARSSSS